MEEQHAGCMVVRAWCTVYPGLASDDKFTWNKLGKGDAQQVYSIITASAMMLMYLCGVLHCCAGFHCSC
jgi:hypothetical protein